MEHKELAISCRGLKKFFGRVAANDGVDFEARRGEILALLGENGSGKTTLMNMLSGIYQPDEGEIRLDGKPVKIQSPRDAKALGIGMIQQHVKLIEIFRAMDNIVLGSNEKRLPPKMLAEKILKISEEFGLETDPWKKIYDMSISEKQTVEIMKVLYQGSNILILDEPTAVLTPQETKHLFVILRKLKEAGNAVIIITHKLNEVMEISDRVTILRKGRSVGTVITAETSEKELTELMVGRPVDLKIERPEPMDEEPTLRVYHLSVDRADGSQALKDVSFDLRPGRILGVYGLAGSGQKELCESIAGLLPVKEGAILYQKKNIVGKTPREILNLGISMSFVPEDRLGMGLVSNMGITENVLLKTYRKGKGPLLDKKPAEVMAEDLVKALEIKTPDLETPVRLLSGGNVQKVLLGREIESQPQVLITAYPVRGLDIHSSYTIYHLLNEQKKKGVSVLYIGEDLDVLLELADDLLVLCQGEIMGIQDAKELTREDVGRMMSGTTYEALMEEKRKEESV